MLDSILTLCGLHNSSCTWTRETLVWDFGFTQRRLRRSLSSGVCAYCLLEVYRYIRGNCWVHRQSRWDFCIHGSTDHKTGSDSHCKGISHFSQMVWTAVAGKATLRELSLLCIKCAFLLLSQRNLRILNRSSRHTYVVITNKMHTSSLMISVILFSTCFEQRRVHLQEDCTSSFTVLYHAFISAV